MRRRIFVIAVTVSACLGAGYWLAWHSPWLRAETVTVSIRRDAAELAPPRARDWRDPSLRARVEAALPNLINRPLVQVDGPALAHSLAAVRGVRTAEVRRGWPNTVAVIVTPRTPVAVYQPAGSRTWQLVDSQAAVVSAVARPPAGWVVLAVAPNTTGGRAAMDVWSQLPEWLRGRVVHMDSRRAGSAATVEFRLRKGQVVVWGDAGQSVRKAQVLRALLRFPAKVYDVSAPGLPTTRK